MIFPPSSSYELSLHPGLNFNPSAWRKEKSLVFQIEITNRTDSIKYNKVKTEGGKQTKVAEFREGEKQEKKEQNYEFKF